MKQRKIIIVGGGSEGWSVAAYLRTQLPRELVSIQLIETSHIDQNAVENASSIIHRFHDLIGFQEKTCMFDHCTQFGLGVMYKDWGFDTQDFILSEEPYGVSYKGINFQNLYIKNILSGAQDSFENYSLSAVAARLGRFVHPSSDSRSVYSSIKYGLHLQLESYSKLLKSHAIDLGVNSLQGDCMSVRVDALGNITSLLLTTGETVFADLFFDCSGAARVLQQTNSDDSYVQDDFDLMFNKVAIGHRLTLKNLPCVTQLTSSEYAVFKIVPLKDREVITAYFSDRAVQDEAFKILMVEAGFQDIKISDHFAYRTEKNWVNNCISLGCSSAQYPELLVSSLRRVRNSIVRFLDLLTDFDHIEASRDEYNRLSRIELENIRETLELQLFFAKNRLGSLAQYFSNHNLSQGAESRLNLFRAHGRNSHDEAKFLTDTEWAAFMLGNNVVPEVCDYDASFLNEKEVQAFNHRLKSSVLDCATKMPECRVYTAGLIKN